MKFAIILLTMGFIWDIRKEQMAEERTFDPYNKEYAAKVREAREKAHAVLEQSEFPRLADQLLTVTKGGKKLQGGLDILDSGYDYKWRGIEGTGAYVSGWNPKAVAEDSVVLLLYWPFNPVGDYRPPIVGAPVISSDAIGIEAKPDGVIVVHGITFLGTTRLEPGKWRGNDEVQEKALEKAWDAPATVKVQEPLVPVRRVA